MASGSEFTPFFQNTYPLALLQERQSLLASLVRYVTDTWEDVYKGTRDPRAGAFSQSVNAGIFYHFVDLREIPPRLRQKMRSGDTLDLVTKAFESAKKVYGSTEIATPHMGDETFMAALSRRLGTSVIPLGAEAPPSVVGAYVMARNNFLQAETRIIGLRAIYDLIKTSNYSDVKTLSEHDALRDHLYARKSVFMRNMLVFGGLLGGDAYVQAVKTVAQEMCYREDEADIQFSIMHFLQSDGRHSGAYMSNTEAAFKKDIKTRYQSL